MMRSLLLALLLAGCSTTAQHGWTAWGQEKYTLNTAQECVRGEDAARLADQALPEILAGLQKAGYIKMGWGDIVKRNRRFFGEAIVGVCLVREPEACCIGKACMPPHKEIKGEVRHARKGGCASDAHAWASLSWPPVCTQDWPDEPHCVKPGEAKEEGWKGRLFHELFNVAIQRWANFQRSGGNYYDEKIYEVEPGVRSQLGL